MQKIKRLEKIISNHSKIRQRFPLLEKDLFGNKRTYLNCGAGTITVDMVVKAMEDAARTSNPMPGEIYPAEIATKDLHWEVRSIAADFLNADSPMRSASIFQPLMPFLIWPFLFKNIYLRSRI